MAWSDGGVAYQEFHITEMLWYHYAGGSRAAVVIAGRFFAYGISAWMQQAADFYIIADWKTFLLAAFHICMSVWNYKDGTHADTGKVYWPFQVMDFRFVLHRSYSSPYEAATSCSGHDNCSQDASL
jgi:hypothetical protein